jgi:hypothetical protein
MKGRQKDLSKADKVVFFNDGHSYWFGETQLKSAGVFIKPLFQPFDDVYWSTHIVLKELFPKEYKKAYSSFSIAERRTGPPAELLFPEFLRRVSASEYAQAKAVLAMKWGRKANESRFRGTMLHKHEEDKFWKDGGAINPFTGKFVPMSPDNNPNMFYDNESLMLDLSKLSDGSYRELMIFDLDLGVCGQSDKVFIETIDGYRYADFDDDKTNEKKPAKSGPNKCNYPMEGMYDCDHFKYTIQLNTYAYLLSLHGFIPRNMAYTHYKDYDISTADLIPVDNYQDYMPILVEEFLKD